MDNLYLKKYLKYKKKYTSLKNTSALNGGAITFIGKQNIHRIVKRHPDSSGVAYELLESASNLFNDAQRFAIDDMINFVLPFVKVNGKYLGTMASDDMEAMSVGSFGITIYVGDLLLKILKIRADVSANAIIDELTKTFDLFYDASGNAKNVPEQVNSVYGYVTSNQLVGLSMNKIDGHLGYKSDKLEEDKVPERSMYKLFNLHCNINKLSVGVSLDAEDIVSGLNKITKIAEPIFYFPGVPIIESKKQSPVVQQVVGSQMSSVQTAFFNTGSHQASTENSSGATAIRHSTGSRPGDSTGATAIRNSTGSRTGDSSGPRTGDSTGSRTGDSTGSRTGDSYVVKPASISIPPQPIFDFSKNTPFNVSDSLVFLFLDKAITDTGHYFMEERLKALENDKINALTDIIKYSKDVYIGIKYLHENGKIHNDLKLQNTVLKRIRTDTQSPLFQIIDFGEMLDINKQNISSGFFGGTLIYFSGSIFLKQRSLLYDWHCLYIMLLEIFRLVTYFGNTVLYRTPGSAYGFTNTSINGINSHIKTLLDAKENLSKHINDFMFEQMKKIIGDDVSLIVYFTNLMTILSCAQYVEEFKSFVICIIDEKHTVKEMKVSSIAEYEEILKKFIRL